MKFKDLLMPLRPDSIYDWICTVLLWCLYTIAITVLLYGLAGFADKAYRPDQHGYGEVRAMYFRPSHFNARLLNFGEESLNMPTTMTIWNMDAWSVTVRIDGRIDEVNVSEEAYMQMRPGTKVYCTYKTGRLLHTLYIQSAVP